MVNPVIHYKYRIDRTAICGSVILGQSVTGIAALESVTCRQCIATLNGYWKELLAAGIPAGRQGGIC